MFRTLNASMLCVGIALLATGSPPAVAKDVIWHVKAVHPKGRLLDVKAVSADGKIYDVKAVEQDGNPYMLDVKALVDGEKRPVKVIVSEERFAPVMALGVRGQNLPIMAISAKGRKYEIRAMRRSGNILHIRAIGLGSSRYPLKAVASDGRIYDVMGIKLSKDNAEMVIGTAQVHAHVKALPPATGE